jgi:hypothetical protein
MNKAIELLQEFDIRLDDDRESRRGRDRMDDPRMDRGREERPPIGDEDDDFDFEIGGRDDRGELDDVEGEDIPSGLSDVDDDDGTFGDERKIDITDRLKKLLSRRGEDEIDDHRGMDRDDELRLSDFDDDDDDLDDFDLDSDLDDDLGAMRRERRPEPDRRF